MYCGYHPSTRAQVQCSSCARGLCSSCDHRIKGYPYCQDCIVLGIQSLSRHRHRGSRPHAMIAMLLAIVPGLGAVYNRQNLKAAVHFLGIVGSFQMANFRFMSGLFALAGFLLYLYSMIDAYRTAQAIAAGDSPRANEERFKRSLVKSAPWIGLVLIFSGIIAVVQLIQPISLWMVARLLPVALILLGGYLLTKYFRRSRGDEPPAEDPAYFSGTPHYGSRRSERDIRLVGRIR